MRRPTLDDIAAQVGVSRGLVSLTLRGLPGASDETRAAIERAAAELGYVPNVAARSLASRTSTAVGVLVNDLHNPFFADVVDGLRARLAGSGLHVLMGLGAGAREEQGVLEHFRGYAVRGAVLMGPEVRERDIDAFGRSVATVLVGRTVRSAWVDTVVNDDRKGAMLAVRHLYELGHRDIAHLDGANVPGGGNARRRGYLDAMASLGLTDRIRLAGGGFTLAHAADGVDQLARGGLPTAIFAANDVVALGALERLAELGVSCPADVSVVGYDNTSYAAQRRVGLTTVDQPRGQIGELAASLIEERVAGREAPSRHVLAPKLVERATTAAPRKRRRITRP